MDLVFGNDVKRARNLVSRHDTFKPTRPENREEKSSKQLWRSNSLPKSKKISVVNDGDPSITFLGDTNIQIIIESDSVPCNKRKKIESDSVPRQKVHESTPVEASSEASSKGVINESYLKKIGELYAYALTNRWDRAKSIFDKFPDMVHIPLTASGDTALHVAVSAKRTTFVKELVNLEYMTPKDLEMPNFDGNTAFCIAAITGNGDVVQIMIDKNENLPIIPGHDGMLPVHLAALNGYHKIVQDLSSHNLLQKMDFKDIQQLFFMTINSSMYDVATKLVEKYPQQLVIERDHKDQLTALHMLARKPSEEFYMRENSSKETLSGWDHQLELFKKLWSQVKQLGYQRMMRLITQPSVVLFDAVKSGNAEAVKWLLYMNHGLLTIRDPESGRNILHFAVLYRQHSIFHFLLKMGTVNLVIRAVDKDGNNVLHFAAHHQKKETLSSLRPNIQMQRESAWFKEVEKRSPPELRTMRNRYGETPEDIFYAQHMKLSNEVKKSAKGMANSGMVVATLIATVAFAAALTVPGDKSSAAFIVFILTNAVALFTSSASIVCFLSMFTSSRFAESVFIVSLHPSLIIGLALLFISIATVVIAFAAASFLIFDHIYKWVAYVVASLGLLPILVFLVLQFSLLDGPLDYFGSRYILSPIQSAISHVWRLDMVSLQEKASGDGAETTGS